MSFTSRGWHEFLACKSMVWVLCYRTYQAMLTQKAQSSFATLQLTADALDGRDSIFNNLERVELIALSTIRSVSIEPEMESSADAQ